MWRELYKRKNFYWGLKPSPLLEKHIDEFKPDRALDIGCGEGRNAIFLAKHGFKVQAIDKEKTGIDKLKQYIKKYHLKNIYPREINALRFKMKPNYYSLVIAVHSLDFLKFSQINNLIKKIKQSVKKGGFVYLSVFSTKEPIYKKIKLKIKAIEKNTFFLRKIDSFRHFFTTRELKKFFRGWKIIFLKQRQKKDFRPDIGEHYHNIIEIIAKK